MPGCALFSVRDERTAALVGAGWLLTHCPLTPGTQRSPSLRLPQCPVGTAMTDSVSAPSAEECVWETDSHSKGKHRRREFVKKFFCCHKDSLADTLLIQTDAVYVLSDGFLHPQPRFKLQTRTNEQN